VESREQGKFYAQTEETNHPVARIKGNHQRYLETKWGIKGEDPGEANSTITLRKAGGEDIVWRTTKGQLRGAINRGGLK